MISKKSMEAIENRETLGPIAWGSCGYVISGNMESQIGGTLSNLVQSVEGIHDKGLGTR